MLAAGLAHCQAVAVEHGGLLASLFLAGLVGSATHCVGMCGPFVLAQTVARLEERPASDMREIHRLSGAALVPYHLGRATTYAGLGAIAALVAGGFIEITGAEYHAISRRASLRVSCRKNRDTWRRSPADSEASADFVTDSAELAYLSRVTIRKFSIVILNTIGEVTSAMMGGRLPSRFQSTGIHSRCH